MIQDIFNVDPSCCSDKNTAEERQASDDLQRCFKTMCAVTKVEAYTP